MSTGKKRLGYLLVFVLLLAVEIYIALYVHDQVIRPFLGDVIVVWVVYCFVRVFIPKGAAWLPLYVFLFAACVEVLQYFHLSQLPLFGGSRFIRIILGSVFDWTDIACYGVGSLVLAGWEWRSRNKKRRG